MSNVEKEEVILKDLLKRCNERLPLYNEKAIKEIVTVFLEELKDAIIKNYCVQLRGYFAIRHKWRNEKMTGNFGNPIIYPAHMGLKVTFSKDNILKPLDKYYKDTDKKIPGSLYDIPLDNFK